jgi:hypothetical protein
MSCKSTAICAFLVSTDAHKAPIIRGLTLALHLHELKLFQDTAPQGQATLDQAPLHDNLCAPFSNPECPYLSVVCRSWQSVGQSSVALQEAWKPSALLQAGLLQQVRGTTCDVGPSDLRDNCIEAFFLIVDTNARRVRESLGLVSVRYI